MSKAKYIVLLLIFFLAFAASAVLSFIPAEQACGGVQTTCYAVQTSQYEETLGIKNSYIGLLIFPILAVLALFQIKNPSGYRKKIMTFGLLIGSFLSIYFLYIQFFILEAICKYCMVVDLGILLSLGIIFAWREE